MPYRAKSVVWSFLKVRHGTRQCVTNIQVDGIVVSFLGRTECDEPGITIQPLVLPHPVDGAVAGILPDRLVESKRYFLDGAVLAVGGAGVPVADWLAGGIDRHIALDENPTVIGVEQGVFDGGLETIDGAAGMDGTERPVGPDNEIRRLAEHVTAFAVTPEISREQTKVLHKRQIRAELNSAAVGVVVVERRGEARCPEVALDAGDIEVEAREIESNLGDKVRCEGGLGIKAGSAYVRAGV